MDLQKVPHQQQQMQQPLSRNLHPRLLSLCQQLVIVLVLVLVLVLGWVLLQEQAVLLIWQPS
jgi:hypothetical protein